ncbi:hypothetical protein KAR91_50185 [Candidatus Pacearchaeota archaeon]|nr:hypothetical protein [Candidatus Pacearchaeota archaeon]
MLSLVTITEELKQKLKLESEGAIQKISQLQGFLAGLAKSQELMDQYITEVVRTAQKPIVKQSEKSEEVKDAADKD